MIIIEHKKEKPINYYKVHCNCGCVFVLDETEFMNYKTPMGELFVDCPECRTRHMTGEDIANNWVEKISKEQYLKIVEGA